MFRAQYADEAINDLADLWTSASAARRREVTAASNRIDRVLGTDADTAGESREEEWRVLFEDPLGVDYQVDIDGQSVTVVRIWLTR